MTEAELEQLSEDSKNDRHIIVGSDIRRLVNEIRRLRGLVKAAEKAGTNALYSDDGEPLLVPHNCPWCHYAVGDWKRRHAPECPAFTEEGEVR